MYANSCVLVRDVDAGSVVVFTNAEAADEWITAAKPGSLTFIETPPSASYAGPTARLRHAQIQITSQVDFLYELPVPYVRLRSRARTVSLAGVDTLVAAPEDLIALKQARTDRSPADDADIAYLQRVIREEAGQG